MSGEGPHGLREEELAFFGAVTASLSHQINNVFTIVGELNGLVEDLLWASEEGRPIPPDRLKAVAEKVGRNVGRGAEYVRLLNRFAHAADHPVAETDLGDLLRLFEALSARFLELKQAKMILRTPGEPLRVRTNPFMLLHGLFACLQAFLEEGAGAGAIEVAGAAEGGRAVIRMEGGAAVRWGSAQAERMELLGRLAAELGADARFDAGGERARFHLTLPA